MTEKREKTEEKPAETVMPGGSPKPSTAEEAEPMRGAGEELTEIAKKSRSGEPLSREEVPGGPLGPKDEGYGGELQRAAPQRGRYGITGRSGEQLRSEDLRVKTERMESGPGIEKEQEETRERLQEEEFKKSGDIPAGKREKLPEGSSAQKPAEDTAIQGSAGGTEEVGGSANYDIGLKMARDVDKSQQREYASAEFESLTGGAERIQLRRPDGSIEAFDPQRVTRDLERAGATSEEAREIAQRVANAVSSGMSTEEMDNQVRAQVRRVNPDLERNWDAYKRSGQKG
ncbi:MAG TPA: ATP cone domain-containing protein [Methanomicrobiales archaeon]|nr:ATP cone domain-containing protein [Methanomicrobiales archaeon]